MVNINFINPKMTTIFLKEWLILIVAVPAALIGSITLFILLSPIFVFRQIVKLFAKCLKPELGEMLSGLSTILAAWGVHSKPICNNRQCSITMNFTIANAEINLDIIEDIGQMVLADNNFTKAKMILVKWMGFYFWKRPTNFDIKSHLILHEVPITQADFENLTENVINNKPYHKEKPLWELHLFSKYLPSPSSSKDIDSEQVKNYCAVSLKFHHCLADFVSSINFLNAINRCLIEKNLISSHDTKNVKLIPMSKPSVPETTADSNYKMLLFGLKLVLYGPFDLVRALIKSANTTIKSITNTMPLNQQESFQLPLPYEYVKKIALKNGVSTPVLTFAAFTGALRKLLVDLDVHPLPENVSVSLPVPLPWKRPKDLGNYISSIHIYAPVNEEDKLKRLESVAKEFKDIKTSIKPLAYHFAYEIIGSLFYWMLEPTLVYGYGGTNCSLAPGPKDLNKSLGIDVKSFRIAGGIPIGDLVMQGFYSGHVNGKVEFRICGDTALFKNSSSKQFIETLVQELEVYKNRGDNR